MHELYNNPDALAKKLEEVFTRIEHEQMVGIPILNPHLKVQTVGFQLYEDRCMGVLITPWLMTFMLFPKVTDEWNELEIGKKVPRKFPSKTYKFMVNEFDEVGRCQSHSLHSPMNEFTNQEQANAAAKKFLETIMIEVEHPEEDLHDEELLGRILRGEEEQEVDLNDFDTIEPYQSPESPPKSSLKERVKQPVTRRDLLLGKFLHD